MSGQKSEVPDLTKVESLQSYDYAVILRAVGVTIKATGLLYVAADLLVDAKTPEGQATNDAVVAMTSALLGMPGYDPITVERVLRNLPDID